MNKKLNVFVAIVLTFFLAFPPSVMADVVGTVTCIEGRVDKCARGGDKYLPLVIGEKISTGDSVRTKSSSKAEITFSDNSVMRLAESTQARVTDYVIGEDGYRDSAVIDLDRGKMRAVVAKTLDMAPFGINTPNASGTVKGSDIFVGFQQSATNVLVAEGVFNMVNSSFPNDPKSVAAGMTSYVPYDAPPADPRAFLPEEKQKLETITGPATYNMEGVSSTAVFTKAVVSKTFGTVRVLPKGTNNWHVPVKEEVLNTGDQIETGESGTILIAFDNGLTIELKPNTQLIITKITRDPQTGNYDNVFESKYGKLVAKLQNKPEGSTFQVKTPHAVCGIRGTIMYMDISPGATKSFFEGGSGYVQDLADGNLNVIQEGKTAAVDSKGEVTESETTDEDRSGFGSEFGNESEEEYGYSDDGGSDDDDAGSGDDTDDPGSGGSGSGEGGSDGSDPVDSLLDGTLMEDLGLDVDGALFDEIVEEIINEYFNPEGEPFSPTVALNGDCKFGDYSSFMYDETNGVTYGGTRGAFTTDLEGFGAEKNSAMTPDVVGCSGTYYNPPDPKYLFFGDLTGIGDDGATYHGRMVGARDDYQTFGAVLAAIYVEPSLVDGVPATGGVMFGGIGGYVTLPEVEGGSSEFYGVGAVTYTPMDEINGFLPLDADGFVDLASIVDLDSNESGSMYAAESGYGNNLSGSFDMNFFNIVEDTNPDSYRERQPWGIWEGVFSAEYYRDGGVKNWSGKFGATIGEGEGYFIGNLTVLDNGWSFGSASMEAGYIDYYSSGTISGNILGRYENDDETYYSANFEGVGAGWWTEQSLSHVSEITKGIVDFGGNSFYMNYDGSGGGSLSYDADYLYNRYGEIAVNEPGTDGSMSGLLGGVESIWSGTLDAPSNVIMAGQFDNYNESDSFVWGSSIASKDYKSEVESYVAYDGGAYYGYAAGVTKSGLTNGFVTAIGISPEGVAGCISADLTGAFYYMPVEEGSDGMFEAAGDIVFTVKDIPTPMAPGGLYSSITNTTNSESMLVGEGIVIDYIGEGSVENIHVASMRGVGASINDAGWGVWAAMMNGSFNGGIQAGGSWSVPLAGVIVNGDIYDTVPDAMDSCYMVRADFGSWSSKEIMSGTVQGIWISTHVSDGPGLSYGKITGNVVASGTEEFIDGGEEFVGSWEGAGAGEWVEEGELLLLDRVEFKFTAAELQDMQGDFISIPVTETFLSGTGAGIGDGRIGAATMDIAMFAQDNAMSGIWAAIIHGEYVSPTLGNEGAEWGMKFTGETADIAVTGVSWAVPDDNGQGQWTATVSGNVDDKILAGTAAGTYAADNTFSGTGAGVWVDEQAAQAIDPTPPPPID